MNNYNLEYSFNTDLREIPDDSKSMLSFVKASELKLADIKDHFERVKILGEMGSYARILERLDEAEKYLNEAVALIDKHDLGINLWAQNGLRLAHIYQWQSRYEIAEEIFTDIEEMCEMKKELSSFHHFAIQHCGKFYFQVGMTELALEYFEEALEQRKKLGDKSLIDSTKYAILMTKTALEESEDDEEDNIIDFPKNDFLGGKLKNASDFLSLAKDHFEGGEFSSIEEMNTELGAITDNQNSMGLGPFLGLSPNDMQGVLYSPFSLENHIFKFECKDIDKIKSIPFIAQAIYFMSKIKTDGFIKATQKGNLSKAFVLEIYREYFSKEKYARLPNKEDDLPQLTRLKHILDMSGLIKMRSGKFSLTKKGEKIIEKENYLELFKVLVGTLFNEWNWGYSDGYSELSLVQQSAIFNIHLLDKKAHDWTLGKELGKYYLEAFPMLVNEVEASYFGPEEEIIKCFGTRFLDRICLPLGLLEIKEEGKGLESKDFYRVTPLFKNIFSFHL